MSTDTRLTTIEATLTFGDGQTAQVLIGNECDSAWGNDVAILGRTVAVREAVVDALRDQELFATED